MVLNKKYGFWILVVLPMLYYSCSRKDDRGNIELYWNNELILPPSSGMFPNKGLAGAYCGLVGNRLVIAGGANFPEQYPWDGGHKVWWSTLYSYDKVTGRWEVYEDFLEQPLAYGLSLQVKDGVLCIGGNNADSCYKDVFLITERGGKLKINKDYYPSLPVPLSNLSGGQIKGKIYLTGGQESMSPEQSSHHFFVMDMSRPSDGWKALPSWPGPTLAYSVCVPHDEKLYLFGGRSFGEGKGLEVHTEGYCYDPETQNWSVLEGTFPVMAGNGISYKEDNILFYGGVESIIPGSVSHPGFSRKVLKYDLRKNTIEEIGESPYPIGVTTSMVSDGDVQYIVSGEVKPGIRTPHILRVVIMK